MGSVCEERVDEIGSFGFEGCGDIEEDLGRIGGEEGEDCFWRKWGEFT